MSRPTSRRRVAGGIPRESAVQKKIQSGVFPRTQAGRGPAAALLAFMGVGAAAAQSPGLPQRLLTQPIDETRLVTLAGNTRPEANAVNDRGPVPDALRLEHIYLQLKRHTAQQQAEDALVNALHDPQSPAYHHWLTAAQIAERFGAAPEDVRALSDWLAGHGFTVNGVYAANGVIDFSGDAAAIRSAFHTQMHNLSVAGAPHIANMSDPRIPAALAPLVAGIVSLNDFRPHPNFHPRSNYTLTYQGQTFEALVPGDLATIYDINPLYGVGVSGQGQTIVVIEDTDLYSTQDWYSFRASFGLTQKFPQGSLRQIHPQPSRYGNGAACADPGVNADDVEAIIDAEWSSAAAPSATIVVASCADTNANFGGYIALQNLLTGIDGPPGIVSISYGQSEPSLGAAFNQYIDQLYEIGVLQGVSIFVSAGDEGAASSDAGGVAAMSGINVSGLASTPFNVAVGGTDFADTYLGDNASYWNSTDGKYFNSALSYVPEIPWNDSCASQLLAAASGFATTYGADGFCNSAVGLSFLGVTAGSGGPSGCAFGTPSIQDAINGTYAVVSGSCRGYAKPVYQAFAYGNPRDGVRDLPDVSLFAGNGVWGHLYFFCYTDPNYGGLPCVGPPVNWLTADAGGGTSFSSPIMAGIQALINQSSGGYQGNPDFVYYALAALEPGSRALAGCNSSYGNQIDSRCIFHDVTLGDNDVNCLPLTASGIDLGTFNCFLDGAANGVLSVSNSAYEPSFQAAPGWDFATGLGSVDAYNLVRAWPGSQLR